MGVIGRINDWINGIQKKGDEERQEYIRREREAKARELFQICEHGGRLWLTYDGHLVCPMDMMKSEPIDALTGMRALFIVDNT